MRTVAQNGLEAWPWVTTAIRGASSEAGTPGAWSRRGSPPETVIEGSSRTVVPPHPANAAKSNRRAANRTIRRAL